MRIAILGAAGRDFHNFITLYREDPHVEVVAFTATQIPGIDGRLFPPELAGPRYPRGIPIVAESDMESLIETEGVKQVVFSYSDVTNEHVARLAARANAAGADFVLPGARSMVRSRRPVIGIGAVRTGVGKSQTTRYLLDLLGARGVKAVGIRHPMPYGNLVTQAVQRFATEADLVHHACTIEEREEYEPYLERGRVVYAGVDYPSIVRAAEEEAEVILWDGGNNDLPLVRPDLHIVLMDPHRPGHALKYYPSEAQVRLAQVVLVAKSNTATSENIEAEKVLARQLAPEATVVAVDSRISLLGGRDVDLAGRRVVCVEDGPTTTHGGMEYGAAAILARETGAQVVDPRPYFVGELAETFRKYPRLGAIVPAMGYSPRQQADLEATLRAISCDVILNGSPIDLARLIHPGQPILRVGYDLAERAGEPDLGGILDSFLRARGVMA